LPPISAAMLTGPACVTMPGNAWVPAECRAAAAASSALDGTHPVFTQVPPVSPRSIMITLALPSTAVIAAANPAAPEPITARSYLIESNPSYPD
jgi:hypothetical protein